MKIKKFKAKGMHCQSCENLIEKSVSKIEGVNSVQVSYDTETVEVGYDSEKTNMKEIFEKVEEKGYECSLILEDPEVQSENTEDNTTEENVEQNDSDHYTLDKKFFGWAFGIIGVLVVGYFIFHTVEGIALPEISTNMGYGLLFVVGLLTGFHCVSMCGGFVVSYTAKDAQEGRKSHKSHLMYSVGKLISYTVIGAAFGLLGSIITFTPLMRGVAGAIAGLFLVVFGLNMLNIFPWLRKVRIRTPAFISKFVGTESQKHSSPLMIGLLNGLMLACGPLQAIYIMAAGTGSWLEGAKLLFIFALGTLPVMLGFGFIASMISSKATHKILKASGVIVIVLGLIMMNRGLSLTGSGYDVNSLVGTVSASDDITGDAIAMDGDYQVINMDVTRYGWEPNKFVLKKGVPVKWVINGKEINGCNNAIQSPKLGLKFDVKKGEQTIEFTPNEAGTIPFSCWMGMIPGTFIVKDDVDVNDAAAVQQELDAVEVPKGGSCGGGSGGCGCGGGRA